MQFVSALPEPAAAFGSRIIGFAESIVSGQKSDPRMEALAQELNCNAEQVTARLRGCDAATLARCRPLLTDKLVCDLVQGVEDLQKYIDEQVQILSHMPAPAVEENPLLLHLRSLLDFLRCAITNFFDTFYAAFNMGQEGEGNISRFDANHSFDIYIKYLMLPISAFLLLAGVVTASYILIPIGIGVALLGLVALWAYVKIFREPPLAPATARNFSRMARNGDRTVVRNNEIVGREKEIEKIENFVQSPRSVFKNMLIRSPTREGKTSLAFAFAEKHKDEIEVYYLNAATALADPGNYSFHHQMRTLLRELGGLNKKVVLIIDEVQELFHADYVNRGMAFNELLSIGDFYCVAITTDSGYKELIEPALKGSAKTFMGRFDQILGLDQISDDDLTTILENQLEQLDFLYSDEAIKAVVGAVKEKASRINEALDLIKRAAVEVQGILTPSKATLHAKENALKQIARRHFRGEVANIEEVKTLEGELREEREKLEKQEKLVKSFKTCYAALKKSRNELVTLSHRLKKEGRPEALHEHTLSSQGEFVYWEQMSKRLKKEMDQLKDNLLHEGLNPMLDLNLVERLLEVQEIKEAKEKLEKQERLVKNFKACYAALKKSRNELVTLSHRLKKEGRPEALHEHTLSSEEEIVYWDLMNKRLKKELDELIGALLQEGLNPMLDPNLVEEFLEDQEIKDEEPEH